jgi:enamine deaminase RidA (YjgF/YER057c/UK114 family)
MRQNISSNTIWEEQIGYSRAVRVGNIIEVSGTTAVDGDTLIGKGDVYAQTRFIFQKIEKALIEAGGALTDVVRTRMYVRDISQSDAIGRAHAEVFGNIKPAASMIEVSRFINPDLLIEIEVTAILA